MQDKKVLEISFTTTQIYLMVLNFMLKSCSTGNFQVVGFLTNENKKGEKETGMEEGKGRKGKCREGKGRKKKHRKERRKGRRKEGKRKREKRRERKEGRKKEKKARALAHTFSENWANGSSTCPGVPWGHDPP